MVPFFSLGIKIIWATYRFSVSRVFSVRVFCSTPKIQRVFARRLFFGRKFARNERFVQSIERQWFMSDSCFPVVQNAPFQHAILPISWAEMHYITPWYGRNQSPKQAWSECDMDHSGLHYRLYEKTIRDEWAFIMWYLTFLYISSAIFVCQKIIKKNCKFLFRVFFKNVMMSREL